VHHSYIPRCDALWHLTHRLGEYPVTAAKVPKINCQFLYILGLTIIPFDFVPTHTAKVKVVFTAQYVNLGMLNYEPANYKIVLQDLINPGKTLARFYRVIKSGSSSRCQCDDRYKSFFFFSSAMD